MSLDVDGFDDLFNTLNSLGQVGKKASKKAVKEALDEILIDLKEGAPRDTGDGADALSIQYIKTNKNGAAWGASGIGKDNWDKTKGLWFQNFGYEHTKNVGWITKIFRKSKPKAEKIMMKTLSDEIDKALK